MISLLFLKQELRLYLFQQYNKSLFQTFAKIRAGKVSLQTRILCRNLISKNN